ncbi:hypothetical protein AQ490_09775 [Wenjunlia vitaminophila]|uniref:Mycothiol-dependent maleylpyruvate isomerase metal-binding domain-containing protein n=1 Tax=Wenjunlia vitaminophila TaxID=76728 RepID=A0A0T6LMG0_WENVI|nr:TIGR03086 family metal-binding protein [Wenjunlia vitaminophila]KRV47036.1 hypothetical protein AQ490_09775 [Wenjunlia vitaminophila]
MDHLQALQLANGYFSAALDRLTEADWDRPTPCEQWSVRDVVEHVVRGHAALVAAFDPTATTGPAVEPGEALDAAYRRWTAAVEESTARPGALERTVTHRQLGELPGSTLVLVRLGDVTVHAWDLAVATGTTFSPDPELSEAALGWLIPLAPMFASAGAFASSSDPGPAADPFHRVLQLTGRQPS